MKTLLLILFSLAMADTFSPDRLFVGSTPCSNELKTQLKIPASEGCEFIKWKLTLAADNTWSAEVNFGMSQPNTNGFKQGGVIKELSGQYWFSQESKVYKLASNDIAEPILLLSMSSSVIHFYNEKGQLLVGDSGYGYALNIKKD